jgi:tryptophan synthase alpha chain
MNRYAGVFAALKKKNEIGFIPFAVAGDPDLKRSEEIFRTYIAGGADILEIGYPFSDPIADGPVNQRASQRAIASGFDHAAFFSLIKKLRAVTAIPFGLLCYANTILHYGIERFCRDAAAAGLDSILVADMPPEESGTLRKAMHRYGLGQVFIVSELTPPGRLRYICQEVDSFVYVVSRLGTTGVGASPGGSMAATIKRLKRVTDKPLAVGFGIATSDHVRAVRRSGADAAIIGSALVAMIEEHYGDMKKLLPILKRKVAAAKAATR